MNGKNESFKRAVVNLQRFGLTFITGCPNASQTVEAIGQRFGPIYETFYGRIFDVKSVPDAKNIAYTSLFLGLHMDLMYFESPPGLQLLHCLKCTVKGGDSIFADSYRAVEILREQYPEHFETLCRVPVTFHYRNNGHLLHFRRPTISADTDLNQRYHVYYAPPFQGPLEVEGDQVPKFYAAFKKFSEIINDPGLLLKRQLRPGDCAIFVNRRVLHGRLAFDRVSGERHLQGTYVGIDGFKDLYRTLMY
jgi:alpha-ketoglutarate-dependent taurine dioxygenase